jgi:CRP-like cAMP-binding protein
MSVLIKIAETTGELLQIFEFRYCMIKSSEFNENSLFDSIKKVSDYQDSLPLTINIAAYSNGKIIGTLRSTQYDPKLVSHNLEYNFIESYNEIGLEAHILDLIVFEKDKYTINIFKQMLKLLINQLHIMKVPNIYMVLRNDLIENLTDILFVDLKIERKEINRPILLDVEYNYLKNFSLINEKELFNFREIFSRIIYSRGEFLMLEGDKGNSAFLIEDGSVSILTRNKEQVIKIGTLQRGSIVGEVAMLTGEDRTASILAEEETTTLCFDRNEFMDMMYKDPSKALDVFKIFSNRLNTSNQEIKRLREIQPL